MYLKICFYSIQLVPVHYQYDFFLIILQYSSSISTGYYAINACITRYEELFDLNLTQTCSYYSNIDDVTRGMFKQIGTVLPETYIGIWHSIAPSIVTQYSNKI
jgi:hypothetical protein